MRLFLAIVFCLSVNVLKSQDLFSREGGDLFQSDLLNSFNDVAFRWNFSGEKQVYLNEGINFLAEQKTEMALSNLDKFIKMDSSFWVAFYYRGVCLKQMGMYRKAETNLKRAYYLNKGSFEIAMELAKVNHLLTTINYLLVLESDKAEKYYKKAINIAPDNPVPNFLLGDLALRNGNMRQALKNYNESLEKDPLFSDAKIKIGLIEVIKDKDITALIPYLNEVLAKDSLNRTALGLRSRVTAKENPKNSLADLNRLVRLSPSNISYRLFRGILYTEVQDYENAFSDFHKVIQSNPQSENNFVGKQTALDKQIDIIYAGYYVVSNVYGMPPSDAYQIKKAFCLLLTSKFQESIDAISRIQYSNQNALCLFLRGVILEHAGDHVKAHQFYSLSLKYDRDIADAYKKRGIYLTEYKKWHEAESDFSEVLRINPEVFVVYKLRGVCKFYQSNYKGAIEDFNRYLARDSTNKEALESRGMSLLKQGYFLQSVNDFLSTNNFSAINLQALNDSIYQVLAQKDTLKALNHLSSYIRIEPNFIDARILKMKILISQNSWDLLSTEIDDSMKFSPVFQSYKDAYSYLLTARGMLFASKKNYDAAIAEFGNAIDIDKTNSMAFLQRGKVHLKQGKTKAAIKDLKTASKLGLPEAEKIVREIER